MVASHVCLSVRVSWRPKRRPYELQGRTTDRGPGWVELVRPASRAGSARQSLLVRTGVSQARAPQFYQMVVLFPKYCRDTLRVDITGL